MSAIAGIYHINGEPVPIEHIQSVMGALQKFPADDIRVLHRDNLFLGCHAQWITPESIGEILPYYDHERKLAITADCIIDNREELFEKLQIKKNLQKTMSDSELILHAYYKWGEETPKHLIGDFAFMIWDEKEQKLLGARDFSGGRTLYYYHDHNRFVFCTTIEPLLSLAYVKRELNEEWLAEFLAISGMIDTVDASITPYLNVFQIPPSHTITAVGNKLSINRINVLESYNTLKLKRDEEYIEAFREIFQASVNSRLRTHLAIGSHLSGGLDSGSVVSFAVKTLKNKNKKLHTFSYIPPNDFKDYTQKNLLPDERPFIKSTVNFVKGIKDHYHNFDGVSSYSEIDSLLETLEMPYKFFENSFWLKGTFEKAHELGIGILLNGDRGNSTISWGPALDYYATLFKKIKWIKLYQELNQYSKNVGGQRLRRIPYIARIAFPLLNELFSQEEPYIFPTLINKGFAIRTNVFEKIRQSGMDSSGWFSESYNAYSLRRLHFEDVSHWNATNTFGTKLSLKYRMWKRDPTNDLRVIKFCLSIPESQFVKNGLDRALIRRATDTYLPDDVRLNQKIRGVQGADWVHRIIPRWKEFISEIQKLSVDKNLMEFIDLQVITAALNKYRNGVSPENATDPDLRILMRSIILSRFINRKI